jgi:hypothetical protein
MSAGDEIRTYKSLETEVLGSLSDNERDLHLVISGRAFEYKLALLYGGGSNGVYTVSTAAGGPGGPDGPGGPGGPGGPDGPDRPIPDVLIRLAIVRDGPSVHERFKAHEAELRMGLRMARAGICPVIFMNLRIETRGHVLTGIAIERYDYSLADVNECPRLMREVFVERDGESHLVALYARAGALVRCIDTKPDNVVVRLDARGVRFALIDVGPEFCGDRSAAAEPIDMLTVRGLESRLRDGPSSPMLPSSSLLVATMSLVVHVTKAALDYTLRPRGFGFPYVRITRVLLRYWHVVIALVNADAAQGTSDRSMSPKYGVCHVLDSYWKKQNMPALTDYAQLFRFLEAATTRRESRILIGCFEGGRAALYERVIALTLGYKHDEYEARIRETKFTEGVEAWDALAALAALVVAPVRVCRLGPLCKFHGAGAAASRSSEHV